MVVVRELGGQVEEEGGDVHSKLWHEEIVGWNQNLFIGLNGPKICG